MRPMWQIQRGLVDVKPQEGLKALKQEIELVNQNGEEKLVIINEFDQEVENDIESGEIEPEIEKSDEESEENSP